MRNITSMTARLLLGVALGAAGAANTQTMSFPDTAGQATGGAAVDPGLLPDPVTGFVPALADVPDADAGAASAAQQAAPAPAPTAAPAQYYIDFNGGSDVASGVSPAAAWKHAPGDTAATGAPAAAQLHPGDRLLFRAGVAYRGHIIVKDSGTPSQPIQFVGDGWGAGKAVMQGGEPLAAPVPCASQAACGGAAAWRSMVTASVPQGSWSDFLSSAGPLLQVAQYPVPADAMSYDDSSKFTLIPGMYLSELQRGVIRYSGQVPQPGAQLALWSRPNVITFTGGVTPIANTLTFTPPSNFVPYADRSNFYAVVNDPARIIKPGQFAVTGGRAYLWPLTSDPLWIGARRQGFELVNANNVTIAGFHFTGFSGDTGARAGIPIGAFTGSIDGLTITRNDFDKMALQNGQGAVQLDFVRNTTITHNTFDSLVWASAVRIINAPGPVKIACNSLSATGRTAIYLQNVFQSEIAWNSIDNVNGIHGNAISLYHDNRLASVHDNIVTNSQRPVTVEGAYGSPFFAAATTPALTLTGNVLDVSGYKVIGVTSWGGGMANLAMSGNAVIGTGLAYRWAAGDHGMSASGTQVLGATLNASSAPLAVKRMAMALACQ